MFQEEGKTFLKSHAALWIYVDSEHKTAFFIRAY